MLANIKALIVVLACASLVFALAKSLFLRFTAAEDFARRRFVWFALTIAAFLSPSFWLYLLIALPLLVWAGWRDSTPPALFVFLYFVIPPVSIAIPTVIVQQLFALTNARVLALAVLLPAVLARSTAPGDGRRNRLDGLDLVLLSYGALQLVLLMPYESITNTMRRGFLFFLDIYLVYFAFSRLLKDRQQLADVMGGLCLAAALFAPLAAFESLRTWLLYINISEMWGDASRLAWLMRDESLRAQVATGHSITLGYFIVLAIGSWMYLKELQGSSCRTRVSSLSCPLDCSSRTREGLGWLPRRGRGRHHARVTQRRANGEGCLRPVFDRRRRHRVPARRQDCRGPALRGQRRPGFGHPAPAARGDDLAPGAGESLVRQSFVLLDMEELRSGDNIIDLVNGYSQVVLFYGIAGSCAVRRLFHRLVVQGIRDAPAFACGGRRRDGLVGRESDGMHGHVAVAYGHVGTALPAVGVGGSPGRFRGLGGGRAKGGHRRRRSETGVQRRAHGHQLTFERLTEASASRRSCIEAMRETSTTYELF